MDFIDLKTPVAGIHMAYNMRTTVTLDSELLAQAAQVLPDVSRSAMLSEALRALIEREAAHRLA